LQVCDAAAFPGHSIALSSQLRSGCVTSAESVLIEQMNIAAMLAAVAAHKAAGGIVVLSTTSQTVTALSVSFALPQLECLAKLKTFFHSVGVDYVLDTVTARHVTNAETAQEFMERVNPEGSGCTNGLLSSTCPGWVCYVEKSQPCALPYLSSVRSPQQVQGVIVKTILARALSVPSSRVFHCTLMPCFDKKLEAMRLQFAPDNVPDVDMVHSMLPLSAACAGAASHAPQVVTPLELLSHLQEEGIALAELQPSAPSYGVPAVDAFIHGVSSLIAFPISRNKHPQPRRPTAASTAAPIAAAGWPSTPSSTSRCTSLDAGSLRIS
jgi:hypothetical protein